MHELLQSAIQQDFFEWTGLVTGIFYVLLAAKEKASCWIFGIISCGCIAYKDITEYHLYADAGLQLFYVVMGVIGLIQWFRMDQQRDHMLSIKKLPLRSHVLIMIIGMLISIPFGYLLNHYTDAAFSYLDSVTTVFSIIATILLIQKYLDNWYYWIVIDIVYVYLYISRGGVLFAFLMIIYTMIACYGLYAWLKKYRVNK